jgi:hypothetical protein
VREPVPDLPADVPTGLAAVVYRCLAKDPKDRFRDGAALAVALRDPDAVGVIAPRTVPVDTSLGRPVAPVAPATAVLTGLPPAAAYSGDETTQKQGGGWLWLVAILLGALLVLVGWALWTNLDSNQEPVTTPTTTPAVTTTPTDDTVDLPSSVCVGQIGDVADSINRRDLVVDRQEQANPGDKVAGEVIDCNPTGPLTKGQTVTVRFWGEAPTPSESPTPTESPTTATTAPTTAATTTPTNPLPGL